MSSELAFQTIIEAIIFVALLCVAYIASYFRGKGRNLATKEDIEEITEKVESIKSQIQYAVQAKLNFRAEEHAALTDYYSKFYSWFSAISNCSFYDITHENAQQLGEIRRNLESLEREFSLAEGKMELFVDNSDIVRRSSELKITTLKFQSHAYDASFKMEALFIQITSMFSVTPVANQVEKYEPLVEQRIEISRKFKYEQIEKIKEIWPLIHAQRSSISEHLRRLMDR